MEVYYNVHRWYDRLAGAYLYPDPVPPPSFSHPFAFARHNPIVYIDPDGQVAQLPRTFWFTEEAGCLGAAGIFTSWHWIVRGGGPRFAHCYASCVLAKCGGKNLARRMGSNKEIFDLTVCTKLKIASGGITPFLRKKHCDSAFQPSDFDDNERGIACPKEVPCDQHCGKFFGASDPAPGPLSESK